MPRHVSSQIVSSQPWHGQVLVWMCLATLCLTGCTEFPKHRAFRWFTDDDEPVTPKSATAMWTDTVMHQPGQPATRGLGGRFHFFADDVEKPVVVDGTLTIYAFDGDGGATAVKPEKKFIFLPEQLSEHQSPSALGPSYSFWLPWDPVGGPQRTLSLIARMESKDGSVVLTKPTKVVLSGTPVLTKGTGEKARAVAQPAPQAYEARTVSLEQPVPVGEANAAPAEVLKSYAIDVPPQFLRRTQAHTASSLPQATGGTRTSEVRSGTGTAAQPNGHGATAVENPEGEAEADPRAQADLPGDRSVQRRFPAQTEQAARSAPYPVRRQPYRATWPSRLPPTPRSAQSPAASQ